FADFQPMCEVLPHVVSAEGKHGHGIAAEEPYFPGCGSSGFAAGGCSEQCSVLPVEGLGYKRDDTRPASSKEGGVDRKDSGIFPFFRNDGALLGRRREACVRVGGGASGLRIPLPS